MTIKEINCRVRVDWEKIEQGARWPAQWRAHVSRRLMTEMVAAQLFANNWDIRHSADGPVAVFASGEEFIIRGISATQLDARHRLNNMGVLAYNAWKLPIVGESGLYAIRQPEERVISIDEFPIRDRD